MRTSLAVALLSGLLAGQGAHHWQRRNVGGGGWFERIAAGPGGLLIACSDLSGAARSHDRGRTWQVLGADAGLQTTHVAGVAFHRTAPDLVYLATEDGVYRSTDHGETFARQSAAGYVEHAAIAPSDANIAYAGWHPQWNSPAGQVHRTGDRGTSWSRVDVDLPVGHRVVEVAIAIDDADIVFVRTGAGRFATGPVDLFRSVDGGVHWTSIGAQFGGRLVDVAIDPHAATTLWASVDDPTPGAAGHLYRSTDRGTSWLHLAQQGGAIWIDAAAPGTVRMFDARYSYPWDPRQGFFESTTGGVAGSWSLVGSVGGWARGWSSAPWLHTAELHAVGTDDGDPAAIYWVNGQFVFGSFDRGRTVEQLYTHEVAPGRFRSRGVDNVVVTDLAVSDAAPERLYAAFLDLGTWRSLDAGASWSPINLPAATGSWAGAGGNSWSLLCDPALPGVLWAPQSETANGASTLLRSGDSGTTWTIVGSGLPPAPVLGLSIDRQSPSGNRRLFATAQGSVYGSVDGGSTWTLRCQHGGLRVTAVDRSQPNFVYAGGEGGLWRSDQGGLAGSFVEVGGPGMHGNTAGLPFSGWVGVHDIDSDPSQPGRVLACVTGPGRGLYRSLDHGATWSSNPILADDHLRCVASAAGGLELWATSSSAVQAGGYEPGSHGIWHSLDAGQSWQRADAGLPWPFGHAVLIAPNDANRVYLGSPGAGIFVRERSSLTADVARLHDATGATAHFQLDATAANAGDIYVLVASLSGTEPGLPLGPQLVLPLNPDAMLQASLDLANSSIFVNSLGLLDAAGRANTTFATPPSLLSSQLGRPLAFAFATLPFDFVSAAVSLTIVP